MRKLYKEIYNKKSEIIDILFSFNINEQIILKMMYIRLRHNYS